MVYLLGNRIDNKLRGFKTTIKGAVKKAPQKVEVTGIVPAVEVTSNGNTKWKKEHKKNNSKNK